MENCEALRDKYLTQLKQHAEKDKNKLIDSFAFSKNRQFAALACSKLATIFFLKFSFLEGPVTEEASQKPEIVGYIYLETLKDQKDLALDVTMDPFSKYNCMVSGHNVRLTNFKSLDELKILDENN